MKEYKTKFSSAFIEKIQKECQRKGSLEEFLKKSQKEQLDEFQEELLEKTLEDPGESFL